MDYNEGNIEVYSCGEFFEACVLGITNTVGRSMQLIDVGKVYIIYDLSIGSSKFKYKRSKDISEEDLERAKNIAQEKELKVLLAWISDF